MTLDQKLSKSFLNYHRCGTFNTKTALKVKGQYQMSTQSNHFRVVLIL